MNELDSALQQLPDPELPARFTQNVAARIAQLDGARAGAGAHKPAATAEGARAWLAWAVAAAGAGIGLGAQAYRLVLGETTWALTTPRIVGGMEGPLQVAPASPAVAVLALGLALYLVGLLSPLGGRDAPPVD